MPWIVERSDSLIVASASFLVAVSFAVSFAKSGEYAWSVLCLLAVIFVLPVAARSAMTGLAVNSHGIRIRRMWRTTEVQWEQISSFRIAESKSIWFRGWEVLAVDTKRGRR